MGDLKPYVLSYNSRGGGGTFYDGLYGKAPPERGTFFRLQVYESVSGISLIEVYKRMRKSVIKVCKKGPIGALLYGFKRSRKRFIFVTDS